MLDSEGSSDVALRLAALARYDILDTEPEQGYDDIVALARQICTAPVALVSFVTDERQWFKARDGFGPCETPMSQSVCQYGLSHPGLLVIPDLTLDARTRENTLVTEPPHIRFYAGARLASEDGVGLGMLCVIDGEARPHGLTDAQAESLLALARQVMAQLELRRTARIRDDMLKARIESEAALRESEARLRFLDDLSRTVIDLRSADDIMATTTRMVGEHLGVSICAYADMDGDEDGFTIRGDWGAPGSPSIVGRYSLAAFGERAVHDLHGGEPLVVNDIPAELPPEAAATFGGIGIQATICMPLVKQGRLTALMAIHDKSPRAWTARELSIIREVTERSWAHVERVGAEQALRDSERRYRTLFEAIDAGFCVIEMIFDAEGRPVDYLFVEANPAFEDQVGFTDAVGRRMRDIIPEHEQYWFDIYGEVAKSGEPARFEQGSAALDRWFEVRAFRVGAPEQHRVAVLFSNNTERRKAELALVEINATLEARVAERAAERDRLWRLSEDMLARADYTGMMSAVSPAWTRVLGWSEAELLSRGYATFMHPDDAPSTLAAIAEMQATGQASRFENRILATDESYKPIEWTVAPEPDGVNFIAVGRDLTAAKAREAEFRELEETLRQSQKMEAVGQLTGGLAHDFNNLLAGISGSLELIQTRLAQGRIPDVDRYVAAAQGAARRAAALTHRLLAFSRRQTLAPKVTAVNALVGGMEELIRRTVGPAIALETVAGGGLWPVLVDANQLENALLNLCINARDAMPDGGSLVIETANRWLDDRGGRERDLPPGQYVSLCVSDNGVGMTPEIVAKAFDPFFTTKPIGVGTGLGLSMIYGFARQSGGQVRIYSEPGEGTMVCLYLPRHVGEGESAAPAPAPVDVPGSVASETVLVVDDEPLVRMLVVELLEELGYRVLEAADGAEALQTLSAGHAVDLLITDVGLPNGMNGRQVADAARAARPALKVLFVTGYAENAVLNHGHLDPGMAVMTKPFEVSELGRRVRDILAERA